jgi:nitrogen regulatory protein PII
MSYYLYYDFRRGCLVLDNVAQVIRIRTGEEGEKAL